MGNVNFGLQVLFSSGDSKARNIIYIAKNTTVNKYRFNTINICRITYWQYL